MDEQLPHGNIGAANGSVRDAAIDRNDELIILSFRGVHLRELISVFVPIL
jgi:hypothetical protein